MHSPLDAYREINHGEHFLSTAHTLANYAQAFYESPTANSNSYEQWQEEGSQTDEQTANKIWKQQLKEYEPPTDRQSGR